MAFKVSRISFCLLLFSIAACARGPDEGEGPFHFVTRDLPPVPPGWQLNVATFNTYGLPLISPNKAVRHAAIGRAIKQSEIELIGFQEAWTAADRENIWDNAGFAQQLRWGPTGVVGSGLMTLSRENLIGRDTFESFTLDGRLFRLWEGDRLTSKGVGGVFFKKGGVGLSFFNLHTLARYGKTENDPSDGYTPERLGQLFEIYRSVVLSESGPFVIVVGDFNSSQKTEEYITWMQLTGFVDTDLGDLCTYCGDNTFNKVDAGQLDHIFVSPFLRYKKYARAFTDRIPLDGGKETNLSDHYGVTATVEAIDGQNMPARSLAIAASKNALVSIRTRLTDYLTWYKPLEERPVSAISVEPLSLGDCSKLEIKCQIHAVIDEVDVFLRALDFNAALPAQDSAAQFVRQKLLNYYSYYR